MFVMSPGFSPLASQLCDFGLARGLDPTVDEDEEKVAEPQQQPSEPLRLARGITGHVVTRWYRAPEVILMEKNCMLVFCAEFYLTRW